jgi:hypothetical protein
MTKNATAPQKNVGRKTRKRSTVRTVQAGSVTVKIYGDQLVEQITTKNKTYPAVEVYPESETNFT